jgi:hypothetical protein
MEDSRVRSTFTCKAKSTQDSCRQQFLYAHPELKYVKVLGDGNCFFRAIAEYYKRTGEDLDGVRDPTDYRELRDYIVRRFKEQINEDPELHSILMALNDRPINKIISELAKTCVWNVPAFEMMVERVPILLNINLIIYKVRRGKSGPYTVTESLHTPHDGPPAPTTISIFLASNHYGLIFPIDAESLVSDENEDENENENENNNALQAAINASLYNNSKSKLKSNNNALHAAMKASLYNNSKSNSNNSIAELEREIAAEEAKAAAKSKAVAKSKAPCNNNLNTALAESLRAVSLNNGLNNNMRLALEASFKNVSFSSRNNRKKLVQQNALNRSMRQNSNNNSNVPVNSVEFKQLTVATLKNRLTSMGVSFGSKNLKAALYQKYKKATRKKK